MLTALGRIEGDIRIIYSSSLNGNLDGCDCSSNPKAGLVKRAHYLRKMKAEGGEWQKVVLVDAGDILPVESNDPISLAILKVYGELGYDALAVGDQEFSGGPEKLLEYRDNYPLISNNLSVCPDEKRCVIFSLSPLVIERAGTLIGIFSLLDPQVFTVYPDEMKRTVRLTPLKSTAENMIILLEELEAELKILLYHGPYDGASNLAKAVPGIDVIVIGHEQRLIYDTTESGTILVSPGEEGNRIGILDLHLGKGGVERYANSFRLFDYIDDPDDPGVRERIGEYLLSLKVIGADSDAR